MPAQDGQPGAGILCGVVAGIAVREQPLQANEEPRPSVVMQQAEVSGQVTVDKADTGLARFGVALGERDLHAGASRWQPEARVRPTPGEYQAAGPVHHDVLPLAELARRDLEPKPSTGPRLQV